MTGIDKVLVRWVWWWDVRRAEFCARQTRAGARTAVLYTELSGGAPRGSFWPSSLVGRLIGRSGHSTGFTLVTHIAELPPHWSNNLLISHRQNWSGDCGKEEESASQVYVTEPGWLNQPRPAGQRMVVCTTAGQAGGESGSPSQS